MNNELNVSEFLKLFASTAPETQVDKGISERLLVLADQPVIKSDELLAIIDDSVYCALMSDFGVTALNVVWKTLYTREGLTFEQALSQRDPALRLSRTPD